MDGEHGQQAGDKLGKDTISTDSGEQQAGGDAVFPDLKLGEAWGESITRGRAAELEARLQAWGQEADHGKWKGPLWSSGDNLLWLTGAVSIGGICPTKLATYCGHSYHHRGHRDDVHAAILQQVAVTTLTVCPKLIGQSWC